MVSERKRGASWRRRCSHLASLPSPPPLSIIAHHTISPRRRRNVLDLPHLSSPLSRLKAQGSRRLSPRLRGHGHSQQRSSPLAPHHHGRSLVTRLPRCQARRTSDPHLCSSFMPTSRPTLTPRAAPSSHATRCQPTPISLSIVEDQGKAPSLPGFRRASSSCHHPQSTMSLSSAAVLTQLPLISTDQGGPGCCPPQWHPGRAGVSAVLPRAVAHRASSSFAGGHLQRLEAEAISGRALRGEPANQSVAQRAVGALARYALDASSRADWPGRRVALPLLAAGFRSRHPPSQAARSLHGEFCRQYRR